MVKKRKSDKNSKRLIVILLICLFIFSAGFLWQLLNDKSDKVITSFDSCTKAGNPIMESYPEQCSANGKTYTNPRQKVEDFPVNISEGLVGQITLRSGDCMPTMADPRTGIVNSSCKTEIYTEPLEVIIKRSKDQSNKLDKEVVKNIKDVRGTFEVSLEPGIYNMYVMYKGEEYCNLFGGQQGEDCEFTVVADQVTNYTLKINEATD